MRDSVSHIHIVNLLMFYNLFLYALIWCDTVTPFIDIKRFLVIFFLVSPLLSFSIVQYQGDTIDIWRRLI